MRVCVLGHRGMLGHIVVRYFREQGCQVFTLKQRFMPDSAHYFLEQIQVAQPDWCVNCIGVGPRQAVSREHLFEVNSLLPELCAESLPPPVGFIQSSTDAVFEPFRPDRTSTDIPDAVDEYGLSKRHAESVMKGTNRYIIRCSIIGPELGIGHNLLNWFLAQTDCVPGYANHYWNGITTLEWAKLCHGLISGALSHVGSLLQPGVWPPVTKSELLTLIGEVWNHPVKIESVNADVPVTRTLVPNVVCPPLAAQLHDLRAWY